MRILLSPAKTLDYSTKLPFDSHSLPRFSEESQYLIGKLRRKSVRDLQNLMGISEDLAVLNKDRYHNWLSDHSEGTGRPAVFAFKGDVYLGLEAHRFSRADLEYAQEHLSILSGLYGLLRPLDLIQPYRLEMGTKLALTKTKPNLYKYWGAKLTDQLTKDMAAAGDEVVLNLASQEYFKAVKGISQLPVISPEFKEERPEGFKMITFFAKKARGLMASFVIKNRISQPEQLKTFDSDGYAFNEKLSDTAKNHWVFTRKS